MFPKAEKRLRSRDRHAVALSQLARSEFRLGVGATLGVGNYIKELGYASKRKEFHSQLKKGKNGLTSGLYYKHIMIVMSEACTIIVL